jgi:tetraacyldisaccharide 4'-kinase
MSARRPWLLPLVPVYAAALGLKQRLFERGPARRLVHPVASVGSLSAGGAGKTPVVQALVELLRRRGFAVDVLSRGYGRGATEVERVDPAGSALRFGDEPLLLARETGARVYVGADRYAAGLLAEKEAPVGRLVHLLDDGFQHRRLARAIDIVLLTQRDVEDHLLPAGNLREPLRWLRRADFVVLREEEAAALRPVVARLAGDRVGVWVIRRELGFSEASLPSRPIAFCGIARPESFFGMLEAAGCAPVATEAFGDHHAYRERDLDRLLACARRNGADGFVTTEKDAVKLSEAMLLRLEEIGPVRVAKLTVAFQDEESVFSQIAMRLRDTL